MINHILTMMNLLTTYQPWLCNQTSWQLPDVVPSSTRPRGPVAPRQRLQRHVQRHHGRPVLRVRAAAREVQVRVERLVLCDTWPPGWRWFFFASKNDGFCLFLFFRIRVGVFVSVSWCESWKTTKNWDVTNKLFFYLVKRNGKRGPHYFNSICCWFATPI